jgi:hypothetical protein
MMQKFRVHAYLVVRVTYECQAEDADAAKHKIDTEGYNMTPKFIGDIADAEWTNDYVVDPLLPNGEVDFDNVKNYSRSHDGRKDDKKPLLRGEST